MKIDIAKKDLQRVRDIFFKSDDTGLKKKMIEKINNALKKVYGHDCNGKWYLK